MLPMKKPLKAVLYRLRDTGKETLGVMSIYDGLMLRFACNVLELPWKDNKRKVSCIKPGRYKVLPRETEKFGKHFIVENVPGRDGILFHPGNYAKDTEGCILPGSDFKDLNADGELEVVNSRFTMDRLIELAYDAGFILDVCAV